MNSNNYNELDDRKRQILNAIIDDYIHTMEPVGSRTIAKKYDMGLSSATIRNEMADLEDMGYLLQPHTSAGRIPSDKGYRCYVDSLKDLRIDDINELENCKDYLETKISEFNEMIKVASGLVSKITQYTSIAVMSSSKKLTIKAVQIVPIEKERALVIVVMANDVIINKLVKIGTSINPELLIRLSGIINDTLSNCPADEITIAKINNIVARTGIDREFILPMIDGVLECVKQSEETKVFTEGDSNILTHPEFNDVTKARAILELLHKEDFIVNLLKGRELDNNVTIKIGSETDVEEMSECSVVSATYSINGICVGTIGVLGPTRMDYPKVIKSLEYVRGKLNEGIRNLIEDKSMNSE